MIFFFFYLTAKHHCASSKGSFELAQWCEISQNHHSFDEAEISMMSQRADIPVHVSDDSRSQELAGHLEGPAKRRL